MREQHLDFLSIFARLFVGVGQRDCAGNVACGLMNATSDLPPWSVGATLGFKRATLAIEFARSVQDRVVASHPASRVEKLAAGTLIAIELNVIDEVRAAQRTVLA